MFLTNFQKRNKIAQQELEKQIGIYEAGSFETNIEDQIFLISEGQDLLAGVKEMQLFMEAQAASNGNTLYGEALSEKIKGFITKAWEFIKKIFKGIGDIFKKIVGAIFGKNKGSVSSSPSTPEGKKAEASIESDIEKAAKTSTALKKTEDITERSEKINIFNLDLQKILREEEIKNEMLRSFFKNAGPVISENKGEDKDNISGPGMTMSEPIVMGMVKVLESVEKASSEIDKDGKVSDETASELGKAEAELNDAKEKIVKKRKQKSKATKEIIGDVFTKNISKEEKKVDTVWSDIVSEMFDSPIASPKDINRVVEAATKYANIKSSLIDHIPENDPKATEKIIAMFERAMKNTKMIYQDILADAKKINVIGDMYKALYRGVCKGIANIIYSPGYDKETGEFSVSPNKKKEPEAAKA